MNFYELNESAGRYSVEVNFRTELDDVVNNWAKLVLGFVSAALKNNNYSVKRVLEDHEKPYRLIVSGKDGKFSDGEWVGVVTHNTDEGCFYVSKGFYRKDTKNVVITNWQKCKAKSASAIYKDMVNFMHKLKNEPPKHPKLNSVKQKTGPTQGSMRPAQGLMNQGRSDMDRPKDQESNMGV